MTRICEMVVAGQGKGRSVRAWVPVSGSNSPNDQTAVIATRMAIQAVLKVVKEDTHVRVARAIADRVPRLVRHVEVMGEDGEGASAYNLIAKQ